MNIDRESIKAELDRLKPLEDSGDECARGSRNVLVALLLHNGE